MTRITVMMCVLAATAAAGCDDLGSPATLDRARILAVRIEPPQVPAGGTAMIDVLVGDASGRVSVVSPTAVASMIEAPGLVERGADGWLVHAPGEPELAAIRAQMMLNPTAAVPVALEVAVTVDGEPLTAIKGAGLGTAGGNPTVGGITFAGVVPDGVAIAPIGDTELAPVDAAGGDGELRYAWFTSVGELSAYSSEHAVLTAAEPGEGQVVVVVRDATYGVTWIATDVRVE